MNAEELPFGDFDPVEEDGEEAANDFENEDEEDEEEEEEEDFAIPVGGEKDEGGDGDENAPEDGGGEKSEEGSDSPDGEHEPPEKKENSPENSAETNEEKDEEVYPLDGSEIGKFLASAKRDDAALLREAMLSAFSLAVERTISKFVEEELLPLCKKNAQQDRAEADRFVAIAKRVNKKVKRPDVEISKMDATAKLLSGEDIFTSALSVVRFDIPAFEIVEEAEKSKKRSVDVEDIFLISIR